MTANYTPLGYCTESDVEKFLLLDIDSSFSDQITDWIAAAEKQANTYMGYTTTSGVLLETITNEKTAGRVDTEGNLMVFPRKIPIVSVSGLTLRKGTNTIILSLTDDSGNNRYDIPTGDNYILYPGSELSQTGGTSIIGSFSNIKSVKFYAELDYIAGYSAVPADIRLATVNLVSDMVMRHANKEGLESLTQGRVSKKWRPRYGYNQNDRGESDFILDAYKLLDNYRIASRWF